MNLWSALQTTIGAALSGFVRSSVSPNSVRCASPKLANCLGWAERDSGQASAPWTAAYSERVADNEETVEASEVLAAVALGPARTPTLVISREYDEGFAYSLLERVGPKRWRLRWSSAYAGC